MIIKEIEEFVFGLRTKLFFMPISVPFDTLATLFEKNLTAISPYYSKHFYRDIWIPKARSSFHTPTPIG